jgi:threonine synthase
MRCLSTRGGDAVTLSEAISLGLARDGGLFLPERLPGVAVAAGPLPGVAQALLAPLFDREVLAPSLQAICQGAFTFAAPTRWLAPDTGLLELFHGPTAAFKDFGARFLAQALSRLQGPALTTVLVATSGDTGAAVAGAFHRLPGFRVVVLYPDGRVAARQAHQLGAFGDNVVAYKVSGTFDDCQRLVKEAFLDPALKARHALASANSISLGRLLPQMAYYAAAALEAQAAGRAPVSFVVPTGNLGNAVACLMARAMGLPIGEVVLATNANRVLPDFLATGEYRPQPSLATLANAMDVGAPSNLERLRALFPRPASAVRADWVDDAAIRARIQETYARHQVPVCPHTACGLEVLARLRARGERGDFVVAATAHPAKFDTVVEPLIGRTVEAPAALAALLARPSSALPLEPTLAALGAALEAPWRSQE